MVSQLIHRRPTLDQDTQNIINAIRRLVQALRLSSGSSKKLTGLSGAQLYVLRTLGEHADLSLGDLAKYTMTDKSSVSVVVQKLVAKAYVKREPAKTDKRRLQLSLTLKGTKLLKNAPSPTQERLIKAISELSNKNRSDLAKLLHILIEQAGLEGVDAALFFEEA